MDDDNPKLFLYLHHALKELDFLVIQELSLFETAQVADMVLTAAPLTEKESPLTNTERRCMEICQAADPLAKIPEFKVSAVQLRKLEA